MYVDELIILFSTHLTLHFPFILSTQSSSFSLITLQNHIKNCISAQMLINIPIYQVILNGFLHFIRKMSKDTKQKDRSWQFQWKSVFIFEFMNISRDSNLISFDFHKKNYLKECYSESLIHMRTNSIYTKTHFESRSNVTKGEKKMNIRASSSHSMPYKANFF